MMRPATRFGATLVACAALAFPMQDTKQDTRPDDTTKKIEALTQALDAQKKHSAQLEKRLDRIEAALNSVRSATDVLDSAANAARANGFEQAGANGLSRSNVIDGMKSFSFELSKALEIPPTTR